MSVTDILLRLAIGPAELFYEMVCTLFLRLPLSPIIAIPGVSLAACLARHRNPTPCTCPLKTICFRII